MKYFITLLTGIAFGMVVGFYAAQHWPMKNGLDEYHVDMQSAVIEQPVADITRLRAADVIALIKQHKVDSVINALSSSHLSVADQSLVKTFLNKFIVTLSNEKQWVPLDNWLTALKQNGHVTSLVYRLQASVQMSQWLFHEALESLYLAVSLTTSKIEQDAIYEEAKALIELIVARFDQEDGAIGKTEFELFLTYAREQQLEYIPVSLALADYYDQSGDIDSAINVLQFLPYDEKYTVTVEDKLKLLEQQKSIATRNERGIPLQKIGSQFVVMASFGGQVSMPLMIDTGASYTSLSEKAIQEINLSTDSLVSSDHQVRISTANGVTEAGVFVLSSLGIGEFKTEELLVLEVNLGEMSSAVGLLGMNFLGQFKFTIDQENQLLFLEPKG